MNKKLGTHDGRFHADEVMATAILKEIYEVDVVRTRNQDILNEQDIVYDVGGGEFDHHGVDKVYRDDGIPYAAAGLIWERFGREVISLRDPSLNPEEVEKVFSYVDRSLIKGIDALDNGLRPDVGYIRLLSIISIISSFNPAWDSEESEDDAFQKAVDFSCVVLKRTLEQRLSVLRAKDIVYDAYHNRDIPQILVLDTLCPYDEMLKNVDEAEEVLFVIYPRKDSYALQTVRGKGGKDRRPLPEAWAGKEDERLAAITGVKDAIFCHTGRFIVVAESLAGIMELGKIALKEEKEVKSDLRPLFRLKKSFFKNR